MSIYDNEARLELARGRAEWLADEMRRTRRLTPDAAGRPGRPSLRELLGAALRRRPKEEAERAIPAYDA